MKNTSTKKKVKIIVDIELNEREIDVLRNVAGSMVEENFSEFRGSGEDISIISFLEREELIYDAYSHEEDEKPMYCLTAWGIQACNQLGIKYDFVSYGKVSDENCTSPHCSCSFCS